MLRGSILWLLRLSRKEKEVQVRRENVFILLQFPAIDEEWHRPLGQMDVKNSSDVSESA